MPGHAVLLLRVLCVSILLLNRSSDDDGCIPCSPSGIEKAIPTLTGLAKGGAGGFGAGFGGGLPAGFGAPPGDGDAPPEDEEEPPTEEQPVEQGN